MSTEEILLKVLDELKDIKSAVKDHSFTTCNSKDALGYLGLKDPRYLTYFANQGILSRRGGGAGGFVYYKGELMFLAEKIKNGFVVPKIKKIYK